MSDSSLNAPLELQVACWVSLSSCPCQFLPGIVWSSCQILCSYALCWRLAAVDYGQVTLTADVFESPADGRVFLQSAVPFAVPFAVPAVEEQMLFHALLLHD